MIPTPPCISLPDTLHVASFDVCPRQPLEIGWLESPISLLRFKTRSASALGMIPVMRGSRPSGAPSASATNALSDRDRAQSRWQDSMLADPPKFRRNESSSLRDVGMADSNARDIDLVDHGDGQGQSVGQAHVRQAFQGPQSGVEGFDLDTLSGLDTETRFITEAVPHLLLILRQPLLPRPHLGPCGPLFDTEQVQDLRVGGVMAAVHQVVSIFPAA